MLCRQAALGQKKEGAGDWDSSGVKADSPDIVRDTAAAIRKRGKYLQAQLRVDEGTECYLTPVVKALLAICKCYKGREWGWIDAENVTDSLRATLLLLGLEGKGTFTHADWSEAWNIAFHFDEVSCIEPHASRLFLSIAALHIVMHTCTLPTAVDSLHDLVLAYKHCICKGSWANSALGQTGTDKLKGQVLLSPSCVQDLKKFLASKNLAYMIAKGGQLFRSCTNTMETWCMYQLDGLTSCSISNHVSS